MAKAQRAGLKEVPVYIPDGYTEGVISIFEGRGYNMRLSDVDPNRIDIRLRHFYNVVSFVEAANRYLDYIASTVDTARAAGIKRVYLDGPDMPPPSGMFGGTVTQIGNLIIIDLK